MATYLGVDPGAKGYLCLLDTYNDRITFVPNPTSPSDIAHAQRLLAQEVVNDMMISKCAIEDVHSIYGMSAKSNFKFGYNVGLVTSLVCAAPFYLTPYLIQPKVWQKAIGAPSKKFLGEEMKLKEAIADIAQLLYPEVELHGPRGGLQDGKADALMLAHYLYLQDK